MRKSCCVNCVRCTPRDAPLSWSRMIQSSHAWLTAAWNCITARLPQEIFSLSDEEQFDEVLEELWVLAENGEPAELGRVEVEGSLPMPLALERMQALGLVDLEDHTDAPHSHKMVLNRCHVAFRPPTSSEHHGQQMIIFTEKGRRRAEDVIRRHRLAEVLFTHTFQVEDEKEIAEQACRFEHILSPEATDRICTFLGHPRTCPHGSLIPAGPCCLAAKANE